MSDNAPDLAAGYPDAERLDLVESLPADAPITEVTDPYRWLEDADDPRTITWSQHQDRLFESHRSSWPDVGYFRGRVSDLLGSGYVGAPVYRGDRCFLSRRLPGQEHGHILVRDAAGERVLIDPLVMDPSGKTTLDAYQPSKEGNLVAYQVSVGGDESSLLRVLDVRTGDVVDGPIDRCRYSPVAWLRGEDAFYYVRRLSPDGLPADERQFHRRVYLHRLGTDPVTDVEVFGAGRPITSYYGAAVSWDGRWLVVSAAQGTDPRNDVWIADLSLGAPEAPQLVAVAQGLDARTGAHVGRDGRLYLATDLDAPRGRLAVADPKRPGQWRDLVAERPDAVLADYLVLDGGDLTEPQLLVSWTSHAVSEVTVHDLAGARTGELRLPGVGSISGLVGRPEGGDEAWFSYTDHVTVPTVLRYHAPTATIAVHARPPGSVVVPDVTSRLVHYASDPDTQVGMFIVARTDQVGPDGRPLHPAPTVLYGYGGFGQSMTPGFSASILAWVEAGGVYAIACLRGGGEQGEDWHRDGMLANKQHTFVDFEAAGRYLIDNGWTNPDRLGISGGSNGGLLVGAALTQWPQRLAAVVCSAPLLDMVRYHRFGLGVSWTGEYGDPTNPEHLGWLLGYSPYHRVVAGTHYPATLFTVFDSDTRVDPLHARKLAAALQHATIAAPEQAPILLRREADVGHGARALSKSVELAADTLAFLAVHTGLEVPR